MGCDIEEIEAQRDTRRKESAHRVRREDRRRLVRCRTGRRIKNPQCASTHWGSDRQDGSTGQI